MYKMSQDKVGNRIRFTLKTIYLAFFLMTIFACGHSSFRKGKQFLKRGEYQQAIQQLSQAILEHPDNSEHHRELGIAYFHTKQFDRSISVLERANTLKPNDGRTLFFIGFCYEQQGQFAKAIEFYREYCKHTFFDPMAKQLQARITNLSLKLARLKVQQALAEERTLTNPLPNTLAVLYFRNVSERSEWNPLIKGIVAILTADFAKLRDLRLLERIELNALIEEINLPMNDLYDRFSAPRAGMILSAERIIVGGLTAIGTSNLELDAGVVESSTSVLLGKAVHIDGRLSNILHIEKELVFSLIEQLDIHLSKTEQEAIQKLPTENTLAFVSFCHGLDFADNLNIPMARQAFSKAVKLDSKFHLAKQQLTILNQQILEDQQLIKLANSASKEAQLLNATTSLIQHQNIKTGSPLIPPANTDKTIISNTVSSE